MDIFLYFRYSTDLHDLEVRNTEKITFAKCLSVACACACVRISESDSDIQSSCAVS